MTSTLHFPYAPEEYLLKPELCKLSSVWFLLSLGVTSEHLVDQSVSLNIPSAMGSRNAPVSLLQINVVEKVSCYSVVMPSSLLHEESLPSLPPALLSTL